MELIPAIDLRNGHCVRLYQGDFAAETLYSKEPAEILGRYIALGARHVHVVDLDGARDGTQGNLAVVRSLAADGRVTLQVGGGLRTRGRIEEMLDAGVERVVIGSVAVTDPAAVTGWMESLGAHRFVLAFDVRLDASGVPHLTTHGWQQQTSRTLWEAVEHYLDAGLEHVLCTDVERDGALSGPNCELYSEAVRRFPEVAWQASGGVARASDLTTLADCGVAAVISGRALLENRIPAEELRPFLPNASSRA
ncbi:MAG TPA: 1-(5-phosphoribosyl)-5-[(5-phosphoribosylamino)methylideneamino]imidazole-4-carboxamide isomerase [Steroidobacteraceae bacterium]|nr:1-(5-phosphoribosyl)-5-[(5-phosphoribosylamino)methylideneamino]imidazole-4-carboxamide isomerase [Steroidobacteraceae bacterium]